MDIVSHTVINLIIFVLAIYVGYHVVWTVTPALHTPLMAVTNAISAIVIVGAMLAAALTETGLGKTMGVLAVALAAVNVFGGFLVTRRMLEMFASHLPDGGGQQVDEDPRIASLTPREREILVLMAQGMSNSEIAAHLVVSATTVKTHVGNILAKLDVRDRVQAVVVAYETGLMAA